MVTRRLEITGLVQGVGFRYSMQREATRLGVSGWVRNRRDGSVEALAQGSEQAVAALTAWAQQGPRGARVDQVQIANHDSDESCAGFEQRPTV